MIPLLTSKGHPRGVFESGGHHPPKGIGVNIYSARVLRRVPGNALVARPPHSARHNIFSIPNNNTLRNCNETFFCFCRRRITLPR
jgi:hypothetical protein